MPYTNFFLSNFLFGMALSAASRFALSRPELSWPNFLFGKGSGVYQEILKVAFPVSLLVFFFSLNLWINVQQGKMPSKTQWRPADLLNTWCGGNKPGGQWLVWYSNKIFFNVESDVTEKYGGGRAHLMEEKLLQNFCCCT